MTTAFRGSVSFTGTSSNLANYQKISAGNGQVRRDKQTAMILFGSVQSSGTPAGSATLELALTDGKRVYARKSVTVTVTGAASRGGLDNASGDWLCTLADSVTGRNVSDLAGMDSIVDSGRTDQLYWMIGMTANTITNFTQLDVWFQTEPAV